MHIEKREAGRGVKYYLAHAIRIGGKVRKIRVYLGVSQEEARKRRASAEKLMGERMRAYKEITNPFHNAISERELDEIRTLEARGNVNIIHLSEEDWKMFTTEFVYDTNAIEGSSVSLDEVKAMLDRGEWPKERQKWEISETYGLSDAVSFIRKSNEHISIALIKDLHRIVFRNSKPFAGKLRKKGQEVVVVDGLGNIVHRGAPPQSVPSLLKEFVRWYEKNRKKYPPILLASVVHNQFETIHPFADGNGRVGRLLMNNILIRHNKPPVNIELKNRSEYYNALREYQSNGNIRPTIELILKEYRNIIRRREKK